MKRNQINQARQSGHAAKRSASIGLLGGFLFLAAACSPTEPVEEDPVAIRMGDREIRLSELQERVDFLAYRGSPATENREVFLERYLERKAALHKALELGLDQDPEFRLQWENLLIGRLRQNEINSKLDEIEVTADEVRQRYETDIEQHTRPAQVRLALLFLGSSKRDGEGARESVRMKMEEARQLARELPEKTSGFGALAMTHSEEATSRFKGGDVGWMRGGDTQYRWPDEVVAEAFALAETGAVSGVIETGNGFYLLKKMDGREAVVRPLDDHLKAAVKSSLLREKRAVASAEITTGWEESVATTVYPDVLDQLRFLPASERPRSRETFSSMP